MRTLDPLKLEILRAFRRDGWHHVGELAAHVGLPPIQVSRSLVCLRRHGLAMQSSERGRGGRWAITLAGRQAIEDRDAPQMAHGG